MAQVIALMTFVLIFSIGYNLGYTIPVVICSLSVSYLVILIFYFNFSWDTKMKIKIGFLWHNVSSGNLGVGALSISNILYVKDALDSIGLKESILQ